MAIIDAFPEFLVVATIERVTVENVDGVREETTEEVDTIECLFWEGGAAEALVSERFRDVTSAAIGVYPDADIEARDIITVQGERYYALSPDDIGAAGEVVIVALELFG